MANAQIGNRQIGERERGWQVAYFHFFSRGNGTLNLAVSGTSVRRYVRNIFELRAVFALRPLPKRDVRDCVVVYPVLFQTTVPASQTSK